jgi:hypothetical protein
MENGNGAIVAVSQAQAALPAADLATHTKSVGVIVPPPDIRRATPPLVDVLAARQRPE